MQKYWQDEDGASAAEFALVVVPFVALILGIIGICLLLYANQTLQFATEAAARCRSVSSGGVGSCTTDGTAQTYAMTEYKGPGISPTFVVSTKGCGHSATGTGIFPLNAGLFSVSIPLTATACFP